MYYVLYTHTFTKSTDWWTVVFYETPGSQGNAFQLLTGRSSFYSKDTRRQSQMPPFYR